jgi:hypothetical protein
MKERLVCGANVASVVRVLRAHRRDRPLPELGQSEQDLLRKRVAPSTWYSLRVFDSLLQIVHRFVFDGSELAAQNMGRSQARQQLAAEESVVVAAEPLATLARFAAQWRGQYNFGEVLITPLAAPDGAHGARVRVTGYPEMSACHGHAIIGYTLEIAERAGARAPTSEIEERPWMHNNVLSYMLRWT